MRNIAQAFDYTSKYKLYFYARKKKMESIWTLIWTGKILNIEYRLLPMTQFDKSIHLFDPICSNLCI